MISEKNFFDPSNTKQKLIKWSIILVLFISSLCYFAFGLRYTIRCEKAAKNPLKVQATISCSVEPSFWGSTDYYSTYLTYEHDGVVYDKIFYDSRKNRKCFDYVGQIITVEVNPDNPAEIILNMTDHFYPHISIVPLAVGSALLIYGIVTEFDAFILWKNRKRQAKQKKHLDPDYVKDVILISFIILAIFYTIMNIFFPIIWGLI